MAEFELAGDALIIHLKGRLNNASASAGGVPLQIPLANIANVIVGTSDPIPSRDDLGMSWFFGKKKSWTWSSSRPRKIERDNKFVEQGVYPPETIEITLVNEDYQRLVLRTANPAGVAAWIMEAVRYYGS